MASLLISAVVQVGLSLAMNALNKPEDQTVEEGRINEARITVATMGTPIMWGFGTIRVGGNLIWSGPFTEVRTERESGGKGFGGPTTTHVSFTYFANMAVAVGKGEASALRKVWFDKTIWYDAAPAPTISTNTSQDSVRTIKNEESSVRFYPGSETQNPDPLMVSFDGDFVPGYRGLCYVVFANVPVTEHGNRIPQIEIEVSYTDTQGNSENEWDTTGFNLEGGASDPMLSWSTSLRKIWGNSLLGGGVLDMDGAYGATFPLDEQVGLTDAKYIAGYESGGFGFPSETVNVGFKPRGNYFVFPNGRCFCPGDVHSTKTVVSQKMAEFNPFNLDVVNQGSWASSTTATISDGEFGGTSSTPSAQLTQWTPVGFLSGVLHLLATGTGSSPITASFYWLDKGVPQFSPQLEFNQDSNYGQVTAILPDRNGFTWAFTHDRDVANTSARGVALKFTVSLDMGLIPGFADQVKLSVEVFDIAALGINTPSGVYYDSASDSFMIAQEAISGETFSRVSVWDPSTNTVLRTTEQYTTTLFSSGLTCPFFTQKSGISNGYGHYSPTVSSEGFDIIRIDFTSLNYEGYTVTTSNYSNAGWFHVPGQNTTWCWSGENWATIRWDSLTENPHLLDDVLGEIIEEVGLTAAGDATFDSAIQAVDVGGYQFPGTFSARQAIDRLSFAYLFDVSEVDGKLNFATRGEIASQATATDPEQGYGRKPGELSLSATRAQDVEIPMRVDVVHLDPFRDNQEGIQNAMRQVNPDPTMASLQSRKMELGIALTQDEAAQLAEKQLYSTWVNRDRYETSLPASYLKYDPTDVITFTDDDGVERQVRLTQTALGNAYTVKIEGVLEDLTTYTSVTGGAPSTTPRDTLSEPGPVRPIVMDLPLLRDKDSLQQRAVGLYTGLAAYTDRWKGGKVEQSLDGVNFDNLDVQRNATPWGYLRSALEAEPLLYQGTEDGLGEEVHWPSSAYHFDASASITVQLVQGGDALASATQEEVLNGTNAIYVGGEIIQFSTVAAGSQDGEYVLSDLIRGRRGTEYLILNGHRYGTPVRLLDPTTLALVPFDVTDRGRNIQFRTKSNGNQSAPTREDIYLQGNTAVPYQVAFPTVDKISGAARGPVDLTWNRRTRVGGEDDWMDGDVEIAVSERYERYEVVLLQKTKGELSTIEDDVTFDFVVTASGSSPRMGINRNGGLTWGINGFSIGDLIDVDVSGRSTDPEGVGVWATNGRYEAVAVSSVTLTVEGTSELNGTVSAFPPDLQEVEGRIKVAQEEAKVYSVSTPEVTITTTDMTDAGYTDGDRLDIVIYQMFFPTADSSVQVGNTPTGERGRPLKLYI